MRKITRGIQSELSSLIMFSNKKILEIDMKIRRLIGLAAIGALMVFPVFGQMGSDKDKKGATEELEDLTEKANSGTPPKILEAGKKGTEELRASGILESALNVGGEMPEFALTDAFGKKVTSNELLEKGHLVVVFYRGAWCPFCNLYLRGLQKRLPEFNKEGANLVAISIEPADKSLAVAQKNKLNYTVLSDPNLDVARKFGIVYEIPKVTNDAILEIGFDIAKYNGMEKAELPLSATYVVSKEGKIVFAFLEPDYKKRADPNDMLKVLSGLNKEEKQ